MALPPGFHFSQASLQDFVDCPRRFQLRHLLHLAWPAVESEPALENERWMQQGQRFHRLVQQHQLGLPAGRLAPALDEVELSGWWESYLESGARLAAGAARPRVETALSAPLGEHRLVAKFDALVFAANNGGVKARIIDWKTSRRHPGRRWLASRLQTRVYPYLLSQAGASFNQGLQLPPECIEMVYWFAGFPDQPEAFPYTEGQCRQDEAYLFDLIGQIQGMGESDFTLTASEAACRFCTFRSLCDRGVEAGSEDEEAGQDELTSGAGSAFGLDLDFEQVAEIKF